MTQVEKNAPPDGGSLVTRANTDIERPALLQSILDEHRYMHMLVNMLDEQMRKIEQRRSADFHLMYDIMHYMNHFPDSFHHPKEDMLLERMLSRDTEVLKLKDQIVEDHKSLAAKGRQAFEVITSLLHAYSVEGKRAALESTQDYIDSLRNHLMIEETVFFPRAQEVLKPVDWEAVAAEYAVYEDKDPLFGRRVSADYSDVAQRVGPIERTEPKPPSWSDRFVDSRVLDSLRLGARDVSDILRSQGVEALQRNKKNYRRLWEDDALRGIDYLLIPANAGIDTFECVIDGLVDMGKVVRQVQRDLNRVNGKQTAEVE